MDEWGVDAAVGGSQKGLMLPTGFSFTGVSAKALQAHATRKLPKHYFDWAAMMKRGREELHRHGADQLLLRPAGIAAADRGGGAGQRLRPPSPPRRGDARARCGTGRATTGRSCSASTRRALSDSVTAVLMPEGVDADAMRKSALRALQRLARRRPRPARRQGVPHRPSRRPERADDPRHPGNRRDGDDGSTGVPHAGRRGRGDRLAGLRTAPSPRTARGGRLRNPGAVPP